MSWAVNVWCDIWHVRTAAVESVDIIIIIIIINVKIIVTLSQKNAAGTLYKTCQNLQLTLCNK